MTGIKVRIIKNLKARIHPVNIMVAFDGIEDVADGFAAMNSLVDDGTVNQDGLLYTLSYKARTTQPLTLTRVK